MLFRQHQSPVRFHKGRGILLRQVVIEIKAWGASANLQQAPFDLFQPTFGFTMKKTWNVVNVCGLIVGGAKLVHAIVQRSLAKHVLSINLQKTRVV